MDGKSLFDAQQCLRFVQLTSSFPIDIIFAIVLSLWQKSRVLLFSGSVSWDSQNKFKDQYLWIRSKSVDLSFSIQFHKFRSRRTSFISLNAGVFHSVWLKFDLKEWPTEKSEFLDESRIFVWQEDYCYYRDLWSSFHVLGNPRTGSRINISVIERGTLDIQKPTFRRDSSGCFPP